LKGGKRTKTKGRKLGKIGEKKSHPASTDPHDITCHCSEKLQSATGIIFKISCKIEVF
jgi:hypothetical protein